MEETSTRQFLRHILATVAYRGGKAIKDAPAGFSDFKASETTRTPLQILAHIGDLFDWAFSMAQGKTVWKEAKFLNWNDESKRFFDVLKAFDNYLASDEPINNPIEKLFQGPVADALTHVGQINLLRRMFDAPVGDENYFKAEIEIGRVGENQAANRTGFD
ncbi:MAG: hypothetical protein ABJA66_20380 [Actinomycetota bacterium]